jgi:hypothetical protein
MDRLATSLMANCSERIERPSLLDRRRELIEIPPPPPPSPSPPSPSNGLSAILESGAGIRDLKNDLLRSASLSPPRGETGIRGVPDATSKRERPDNGARKYAGWGCSREILVRGRGKRNVRRSARADAFLAHSRAAKG